jgi:hypothetical protein
MVNSEERVAEIRRREKDILRKRREKRREALAAVSGMVCVLLIAAVINYLPVFRGQGPSTAGQGLFGAMFAGSPEMGLAAVMILAFALGVCAALLCVKTFGCGKEKKNDAPDQREPK